jgi:hypothetical protein
MHAVVQTRAFEAAARSLDVSDAEIQVIVETVARDPLVGDVIVGTGGARKWRFGTGTKGKRGGYRIITFYGGIDVPVFLMDIYGKNERVTLTTRERNQLKDILRTVADDYRSSTKGLGIHEQGR